MRLVASSPVLIGAVLGLVITLAPPVRAEGETGIIAGRILFSGPVPPPQPFHIHHDSHACGTKSPVLNESLVVDADHGLANAVVMVSDAPPSANPKPAPRTLEQQNCTFVPHVISATVGATLRIGNSDPLLHNVHAFIEKRTFFNLAMPLPGVRVERVLETPGLVSISCDSGHSWMSAFIMVVPHDLHVVTNQGGNFVLAGVPPGKRTISVWHEQLGVLSQVVEVPAGGGAHVTLTFAAQEKKLEPELLAAMRTAVSEKLNIVEESVRRELATAKQAIAALIREGADEGRAIYLRHCATCHGARGDGEGPSRRFLRGVPRDLTRGEFKFKSTESGALARPEDIYRTLSMGVLGTEMPAWRDVLSQHDRWLVTRFVMSLSNRYDDLAAVPAAIQIGAPPPVTPEAIARGEQTYKTFGCVNCHGPGGAGDGLAAAQLVDGWGHPIAPADLTRPYYKGGRGPEVLYRAIATGLAGTPMPAFGAALQGPAMWDLVFYVQSLADASPFWDYLGAPAGRIAPP
jgi:cytochrome c oxidase cbb3-type subunit 2